MSNEPTDELSCATCKLLFSTVNDVRVHEWQAHHGSPSTKCEICITGFTTKEELIDHVRIHYLYCCHLCLLNTNSWTHYVEHVCEYHKANSDVLTWKNEEKEHCVDAITIAADLETHFTEDYSEKFREFNSEWKIGVDEEQTSQEHMFGANDRNKQKLLTCYACSKTFKYKSDLKRHIVMHTGEKSHICPVCRKGFSRDRNLKLHIANIHDKNVSKNVAKKFFDCHVCHKTFVSTDINYLKKHLLVHSGEKPHVCHVCSKAFRKIYDLERHLLVHTGEKPHICPICEKSFSQSGHMKQHITSVHDKNESFSCHVCSKAFTSNSQLKRHLVVHTSTGEKPHVCPTCDKGFWQARSMKQHVSRFHEMNEKKTFPCQVCGKVFMYKCHLARHRLIHNGEKPHHCHFCEASFNQAGQKKLHIIRVHEQNQTKSFTCVICSKAFADKSKLKKHLIVHSDEKPHLCPVCNKDFKRAESMERHILLLHNKDKNSFEEKKSFACHVCSKAFVEKSKLKRHLIVHTDQKPHLCPVCQKCFTRSASLRQHILLFHDQNQEKPFSCHVCSKAFMFQSDLKRHCVVHTGEKPHVCTFCNKGFGERRSMKRHISLVHEINEKKPFSCHICSITFISTSFLEQHLAVHTGEKSHHCPVCNKSFISAGSMKKHMTRVHEMNEKKPFPCGVCSKAFINKSDLKRHHVVHTGEKPHLCPVCNKGFSLPGTVKHHILSVHNKKILATSSLDVSAAIPEIRSSSKGEAGYL